MGKLPFVVAPKIESKIETLGTEVSGQLEIERKGYLTDGEKAFMANVNNNDDVIREVMKLSRAVAKKYKLDQQSAYDQVVLAVSSPDECKYPVMDDFGDEITAVATNMMSSEARKQLMKAFCLLVFRVNKELEIDDIAELHEDLVSQLSHLYDAEESQSIERLVGATEDSTPESVDVEEAGKK